MEDILDIIRNKVSLTDVISKVIKLSPKGREYIGCCPFHTEKTPSFYVNPYKGFYYCFGCGAKGNIFSFYTNYYQLSFSESLKQIALDWGIELPKNINFKSFEVGKNLIEINRDFSLYCKNNLNKSKDATSYLNQRGVNKETIKNFDIGYSCNYNESDIITSKDIPYDDLLELGLFHVSKNGTINPFFRNRLMFPIKDISGKIIGFGGRVLDNSLPKYLNSKESKIFSKRNTLYGLYQAIPNLKKSDLIIVEGYMDVIALHQAGFNTAVACLGTSITVEHLQMIHRYSTNPVFSLDGDVAGIKALYRLLDIYLPFLKPGMNPKFVILPNNEDPDSFIKNNSADKFQEKIQDSKGLSQTLFDLYRQNKNLILPEDNAEVLYLLKQKLNLLTSGEIKRSMLGFFSDLLYKARFTKSSNIKKITHEPKVELDVEGERAYLIFGILIGYPSIFETIEEKFGSLTFNNNKLNNIKDLLVDILTSKPNNSMLQEEFNKKEILELKKLIENNKTVQQTISYVKTLDRALEVFESVYNNIKIDYLKMEIQEVNEQIRSMYNSMEQSNGTEVSRIKSKINTRLKQLEDINHEIKRLHTIM